MGNCYFMCEESELAGRFDILKIKMLLFCYFYNAIELVGDDAL